MDDERPEIRPAETPAPLPARQTGAAGRRRAAHSNRGKWTIVAIFLLGGGVTAGLFLAPRAASPAAPTDIPYRVPPRGLRAVIYDLSARSGEAADAAAAVRAAVADPDVVMLAGLTADEAPAIARALGMDASYAPPLFQRVTTGPAAGEGGVCVLSKHPLYEGRPLRLGKRETFGVAAVLVADGCKVQVACVSAPQTEGNRTAGESADGRIAAAIEALDRRPTIVGNAAVADARGARRVDITTSPGWAKGDEAADPSGRWASLRTAGSTDPADRSASRPSTTASR